MSGVNAQCRPRVNAKRASQKQRSYTNKLQHPTHGRDPSKRQGATSKAVCGSQCILIQLFKSTNTRLKDALVLVTVYVKLKHASSSIQPRIFVYKVWASSFKNSRKTNWKKLQQKKRTWNSLNLGSEARHWRNSPNSYLHRWLGP